MELLSRHFWSGGYDGHGQRVRIKKRGGGRREATWTAQSEQALAGWVDYHREGTRGVMYSTVTI